ncbi:TetR/AcrR family transcriptional regulator [Corynebacterium glyciniphilum]|uniref:TetR/AcrR family transcriptional regulator n=1 Tax=Corynebacterium glyciniphilum TaxID=1404244 RepID=UPI0026512565|nr:TetR/AcrR family transcriptional regulator [Corynebacterium glyciniphilum]MDN5683149.1 TetR/AcrR family transcriptional regulator [Corynebacterium glyciniphilum]MDN6707238.1 TetR/AcrR family transcriptional regulator [Corynebacterium glyciniphilum]
MPRRVDHDQRRHEIIGSVWLLIADEGLDAVTTRRIADATGFSNGLLRYYFPGKDAVVTAAFEYVYAATNERAGTDGRERGRAGLERLAEEILPLDAVRRAEARVVTAFWQRAVTRQDEAEIFAERMSQWHDYFLDRLDEAAQDGDLWDGTVSDEAKSVVVDELLTMLTGAQVWAALNQDQAAPERLRAQLTSFGNRVFTS